MIDNNFKISPEMTVLDFVCKYGETEAVFRSYDAAAGECICCNALFKTVKEVSEKYGIDLSDILRDLKAVISGRSQGCCLHAPLRHAGEAHMTTPENR